MARTAKIAKSLKKPKFKVRIRTAAASVAARAVYPQVPDVPHLFRGMALKGEIPGVVKASW